MPRFGKRVLISPSQEAALEEITGWDDIHQGAGIIDETPTSQPADAENSTASSLERVFDVTGSSLCSGASQQAVEFVSPPWNVAVEDREREEDSYNEAFESDRSQSPARTVSWSLPAGPPKSPTTSTTLNAVAVAEVRKSELSSKLKPVSEVKLSNRPHAVPLEAAAVTAGVRLEAEEDAEERPGTKESSGNVGEANGGGGRGSKTTESRTTTHCEAWQHVSPIGIGLGYPGDTSVPQGCPAFEPSPLPGDGFGSGSTSALTNFRSKEKDYQNHPQPAWSVEHHSACGMEKDISVRTACNLLDQIANSLQVNMEAVDRMVVVDDDHSGKEVKSGDKGEKRLSRVHHELNTVESVGERGVYVERVVTQSKVSTDELGTPLAADHCQCGREFLSGQEKSKEPLLSPTPSRSVMDAENFRSAHKIRGAASAACVSEGGGQWSPPSPPRPPRAVQDKLDKLRSLSGSKRPRSAGYDLLRERSRTEGAMISASTVLEAMRLRSGERPAANVTAADLLKTALDVGITLPPPFHRNYFSGKN